MASMTIECINKLLSDNLKLKVKTMTHAMFSVPLFDKLYLAGVVTQLASIAGK